MCVYAGMAVSFSASALSVSARTSDLSRATVLSIQSRKYSLMSVAT